jgi:hypothetical protein
VANELTLGSDAASAPTTFARLALRYSVLSSYGMVMLIAALLWAFGVTSGWLPGAAPHGAFLMLWVMNHTLWSTRLLRLGHLPYPRARMLRFVAWPPLAAVALGASLGVALPPSDELCRLDASNGGVTLKSEARYFRLTTGEPPVVLAPDGESHQPVARRFGLGAALVMYDPYEVPPAASRAFLVHQLGRLLSDQRGLSLEPEEIQQRFLSGFVGHRRLDEQSFPELRDPLGLRTRLISALGLVLAALVVMFCVVHAGSARDPQGWNRGAGGWLFTAAFIMTQLVQVASGLMKVGANPVVIALSGVARPLAEHVLLAAPAAVALGVWLYRGLRRRFDQMEAPLRAKMYDNWFVEM